MAARAEWADSGAARRTDSLAAMLGAVDMRAEWAGPAPAGAPYHWAVASAPSRVRRVGVAVIPAIRIGVSDDVGRGLAPGPTCAPAGAFALGWAPPPTWPQSASALAEDYAERSVAFADELFEASPGGGALTHSCERCGDCAAYEPAHTLARKLCPLPRLLCDCLPLGGRRADSGRTDEISLATGLPMLRLAATMTTPRSRAVSVTRVPLARYWLVLAPFEVDDEGCLEAMRGARRGGQRPDTPVQTTSSM